MKPFHLFTSVMMFCLISTFALQAQENESLLAAANPAIQAFNNKATPAAIDFTKGQTQAQFKDLQTYVTNNLEYPALARKNSIEGTVSVLVFISEKGKITDAKVMQSLGLGCNEAALDLVRNMPTWIPASNAGVFVKSKQVIEINFRLQ